MVQPSKQRNFAIQLPHFSSYLSLAFCIVVEFKCTPAAAAAFLRPISYKCLCSFRYNSGEESIASTSFLDGVDKSDHVLFWYKNSPRDMIWRSFSGKHVLFQFSVDIREDKRFSNVEFQIKRCGVY
ncbi:hypothetical protein M5689_022627 [Euphorbia peplus]|nr:hypothetical protein M5689_022627 [Euphorbia peplus]